MSSLNALTVKDAVVTPYLAMGRSFSPSSMVSSWKLIFALSRFACTVEFCTSNSSMTDFP